MGYGTLTPHLLGTPLTTAGLMPGREKMVDLMQLQAVCRSGVVFAASFSPRTPLQHASDGSAVVPRAYGMHDDRNITTLPHVSAASLRGTAARATSRSRAAAATQDVERAMPAEITEGADVKEEVCLGIAFMLSENFRFCNFVLRLIQEILFLEIAILSVHFVFNFAVLQWKNIPRILISHRQATHHQDTNPKATHHQWDTHNQVTHHQDILPQATLHRVDTLHRVVTHRQITLHPVISRLMLNHLPRNIKAIIALLSSKDAVLLYAVAAFWRLVYNVELEAKTAVDCPRGKVRVTTFLFASRHETLTLCPHLPPRCALAPGAAPTLRRSSSSRRWPRLAADPLPPDFLPTLAPTRHNIPPRLVPPCALAPLPPSLCPISSSSRRCALSPLPPDAAQTRHNIPPR
ncbi:hypothetical protein ZIOFF_042633 [Zingiber officinale]|uniref:Uncharacterized protein n=1 Tax=Zingiber officinale TaxID=94328 RepID=A0A8J5FVY6_ZINOF|nr:hypothetical protein ZIOFF_042633 [Zingiber officinale]